MDKLASLWSFVRKHKYLITLALFAVIIGFLDENSVVTVWVMPGKKAACAMK